MSISIRGTSLFTSSGKERTEKTNVNIISQAKNLYSRFTIIRETDPRAEKNVWPENLPGFKETVGEYHAAAIGNRQYGIAPHTDNSMMTCLAQANIPGLAVRMPSGHWRLVEIIPGTLLVNTGNVLVRWTNDQFLSTKHRVINTHTADRYSIPVFFGPNADAMIEVVPTCQGPSNPPRYEPVTYRASRKWYYGE